MILLKKKGKRRDGYILQIIISFVVIMFAFGVLVNTVGCGGGGATGVIPNPTNQPTPNVTIPPNPETVAVNFKTQRANGKIDVTQLTGLNTLATTTVNLDNDGNGGTLLAKNADFNGLLYDAADLNNAVFSKNFSTGNDATEITFDESQPPDPTPTNTPTPDPQASPTNTPDPANPTPTNTPVTPVPTVEPPNPGTVQDFVTLTYDIEGIAYNPNNGHFYFGQSNATIVEYDQNAQYVTATTEWGGGAQPIYLGICYNNALNQVGGNDSNGRINVYSASDLSFIKRGITPSSCSTIDTFDTSNWIIGNYYAGRLEMYNNSFSNNEVLTPYQTVGSGILNRVSSFDIDHTNRFVCAGDSTTNLIKIINNNGTLHDQISQDLNIDVDTFYQYYFVTHATQGYMNIIDSSDKSILVNNVTGVSCAKYVLIVNRTCYFSTAQKKIQFFTF